ncbi:MAG: hypothetical protein GX763_08530 [Clostridiaceae bacterium]|nr:hypothetical protein [Clostridiaceae bacterium]
MVKTLFKSHVISIFRAAEGANGAVGNDNEEPLIHVGDKSDDLDTIHPYIKFERVFSWLHALFAALFFYTASLSFISGLSMARGTAVIWVELVVDLILTYFLFHILIDLGVNPQKLATIPYIAIILRMGFSLFTRILPKSDFFAETNLVIWMPVVMALSLLLFVMAFRIKKSRQGRGMFVEQSEAAFTRDRKHNLDSARILTIILGVFVLLLMIANIYLDVTSDLLTDYAALQFVTVVKYLFMLYVLYRLIKNLFHLIKRDQISMIKWGAYLLFDVLLIINLMIESEYFSQIALALVWIVLVTLSNAAIFYINE